MWLREVGTETRSVRLVSALQEVFQMRKWLQSLTSSPRGFAADGRRLGLGLATAMEKQRQATTHGVEEYLREQPKQTEKVNATV
jgi:hypothetical protein